MAFSKNYGKKNKVQRFNCMTECVKGLGRGHSSEENDKLFIFLYHVYSHTFFSPD